MSFVLSRTKDRTRKNVSCKLSRLEKIQNIENGFTCTLTNVRT
jgi:hypothetical protein